MATLPVLEIMLAQRLFEFLECVNQETQTHRALHSAAEKSTVSHKSEEGNFDEIVVSKSDFEEKTDC